MSTPSVRHRPVSEQLQLRGLARTDELIPFGVGWGGDAGSADTGKVKSEKERAVVWKMEGFAVAPSNTNADSLFYDQLDVLCMGVSAIAIIFVFSKWAGCFMCHDDHTAFGLIVAGLCYLLYGCLLLLWLLST